MARKVLIIDTSLLCCLLNVPGLETAGPDEDRWDHARIAQLIDREVKAGATLVLPLASIIETGNHVAQAGHSRLAVATELARIMILSANQTSPWAAFTDQASLWSQKQLLKLASDWPALANQRISIGDATIKDVAEYYAAAAFHVEILTGDAGLKAYEPAKPPAIPRRRRPSSQ